MQTYEVEVEVQGAEPQTVGRKQRYEVRSTTVGQAAKEAISDFLHDQGVHVSVSIKESPRVKRL